jgi:hypothetical protein
MRAYVVRELVSVAPGEKDLRTHYEYGIFDTYEAANQCAIATRNQHCFPQREEVAELVFSTRIPAVGVQPQPRAV